MDRNPNARLVEPFDVEYNGFVLKCRPQPTPQGRFLAYVIIMPKTADMRAAAALMPDVASFARQTDAADCAAVAGRRWVDQHA